MDSSNKITIEDLPQNSNSPLAPSLQAQTRAEPVTHLALASRFGIDTPNSTEEGKLVEIWAYCSRIANTDNISDILWEAIHTEQTLGSPRLGESRLDRLYRYCKLRRQEKHIQDELKGVVNV